MKHVPVSLGRNAAQRKSRPRQLKSKLARLRPVDVMLTTAERLAGLGSWYWDVEEDRFTWSDETYRLLGLERVDFDGTMQSFLRHVHPNDRRALRKALEQVLARPGQFSIRYRITGRDGRQRLVHGEGEAQTDKRGRLQRLVGTVVDVTEREQERKALRDSEARLRSLLELSSDSVWEVDAEFRFTMVSTGAPRLQEFARIALGRRPWEIPFMTPVGYTWEEHQEQLAQGKPMRDLEARFDAQPHPLYLEISGEPFFDENGVFAGYRGITRDITQRKQAEEQLRQLNTTLRMAVQRGRIGVWSLQGSAGQLSWWEGGHVIHAMDGRPADSLERLLERVEPSARDSVRASVERCFADASRLDVVLPLRAGAHPVDWVRLVGEPRTDARGQVTELHGTSQQLPPRSATAAAATAQQANWSSDTITWGMEALVTVNRDWIFTSVNDAAEQMLHRRRQEILGRNLWEAFPEARGTVFDREYHRAMAEGEPAHIEEFYDPLGRWLKVDAYPSPQGLAIYIRDITDGRSMHAALADTREEHRTLFDNIADAVLYTSVDGVIVRANPAACTLFHRREAKLCGMEFGDLLAPMETRLPQLWAERARQGRTAGQLEFARADGSCFHAEVSSSQYRSQDGSVRAFVIVRDISDRLAGEREVRQLNAELSERVDQRTAELAAANAELQAFAHSLAHDLKAPAGAIDAYSQLLERALPQPLPPRAAQYLSRIRAAATRTGDYAQGLLALAQATHGPLTMQLLDLSAIARDVLAELAAREPERKVVAQVQPGVVVLGDGLLLRMVMENLLGNAWKFTRDQPAARIEFRRQQLEGETVYLVRDNGVGFDMAHAAKLFGSFQRLHPQSAFPGTGIGLANVRRIVVRHGGRIWAEGAPGQGACFYFTLSAPEASPGG